MDELNGSMSNIEAIRSRLSQILMERRVFHRAKVLSPCGFGMREVEEAEGLSSSREDVEEEEGATGADERPGCEVGEGDGEGVADGGVVNSEKFERE